MYIIGGGTLLTFDPERPFIKDGECAVDGTNVLEIGIINELRCKYPDAEYISAEGGIIMPGLINAHTHICRALASRLGPKGYPCTSFEQSEMWHRLEQRVDFDIIIETCFL